MLAILISLILLLGGGIFVSISQTAATSDSNNSPFQNDPIIDRQIARARIYLANLFPDKILETTFLDFMNEKNLELHKEFTIFKVKIGERTLYVTHDKTNDEIMLGTDRITQEYQQYLESLPKPFQKMSKELRLSILESYGEAPNPAEVSTSKIAFAVILFANSSENLDTLERLIKTKTSNYTKYDGLTIKIISTEINLQSILDLASLDCITGVWLNEKMENALEINFSVPYLSADDVNNLGIDGTYSQVGLIDSGVDITHPNMGSVLAREDFTDAWWDIYDWNPDDTYGHGTYVAGVIASNHLTYEGMAPGTNIISAKVIGGGGSSELTSTYIAGIDWAIDQGADVIQFSLLDSSVSWEERDGDNQLAKYVDYCSYEKSVVFVKSAGNNGPGSGDSTGHITAPADAYNLLAVAATDATFTSPAYWSSYGDTYDGRGAIRVVAPGEDIDTCNNSWETDGAFISVSGTSLAAPHVSGLAALLYDLKERNSDLIISSPELLRAIIMNSATKLSGWTNMPSDPLDFFQGTGQVDALEAYNCYNNPLKWDYRFFNDVTKSCYYTFDIENTPFDFSATIAWDRHITDYNAAPPFPDINDIDLKLYNAQGQLLKSSISTKDNVEHIFCQISEPGTYFIEVDPSILSTGGEYVGTAFNHEYSACSPLSVSISPTSVHMTVGESQQFISSITGGVTPYTYQWYVNGAQVAGATDSTYIFSPSFAGNYTLQLKVTSVGDESVQSNVAVVQATSMVVSINSSDTELYFGQSSKFIASVSGGVVPYSYQWYLNDSAVLGATSETWMFTPKANGNYVVYVNVTDSHNIERQSNVLSDVNVYSAYLALSEEPVQGTYCKGQQITFSVTVFNRLNPPLDSSLVFTVAYPNGYYLCDPIPITVGADSVEEYNLWWVVPEALGTYVVEVHLTPSILTASDILWLEVV